MDNITTLIYDTDIRIKAVSLKKSLTDLFSAQGIPETKRELFTKAALIAAAFSSEEKDDDGAVYVSVKDPATKTALTAVCETDGRLRGCMDEYRESSFKETVLTVGRKLAIRGDYQSSVMGENLEEASREYFKASRQTKAKIAFFETDCDKHFVFAEYFPGHDVNFKDENVGANAEYIEKKLCEGLDAAAAFTDGKIASDKLKKVAETPVIFGCTCNKRRIKKALVQTEGLTLPVEVKCRFCGKTYIIDNL